VIAADTSTWVAYLAGETGRDVELLDQALKDRQIVMVPAVLTELLSDPKLPSNLEEILGNVPLVPVEEGYWQRAGKSRSVLLRKGRKARLGDSLIAQSCIDAGVSLVARDGDFRAFAEATKLGLVVSSA